MPTPQSIRIHRRAALQNLQLLVWLRWFAIVGMIVAVGFTQFLLRVSMPIWHVGGIIVFLIAANLVASLRLRRPEPGIARAVVADLMVDVVALAILLYLTGGANNPFSGLFVLQAIVAAFLLSPIEAGAIFLATIAAQLWLLGNGLPLDLPMGHMHGGPNRFDIHLQGMFLSFFFSSALAVLFILGIKDNLRMRDERLERLAEQIDEEKVVLRLGLLASTAAHDLGTPLTNLAVILDDWADLGVPDAAEQQRKIAVMQQSVATCRERISHLLAIAGQSRLEDAQASPAAAFVADVAARWQATAAGVTLTLAAPDQGAVILTDILLESALFNLFDNSREAGATRITAAIATDDQMCRITLQDNGCGFPPHFLGGVADNDGPARSGDPLASHGLGLFLVRSVLRRLGGRLALSNPIAGGAMAEILIPLVRRHG